MRNESCRACRTREEEDARAGDAGGDVAQHVDLRAPRAHRLVAQDDRHAAGLQRRAHRLAHVDLGVALAPAQLVALRLQPALELGDDAVHGGEVLQRPAGQRAVELVERARGRQRRGALDLAALELLAQQRLEAADGVARQALGARVVGRQVGLGLGAQAERAADALDVDADDARALALAPEGGDGQPREVAHQRLLAVAQGLGDLLAQRLEVELGALGVHPAALGDPLAHGRHLGGAEEEAVEDEVEDPPVLLGLGQRRGQALLEVDGLAPRHLAQDGEGVEQLAGADRDALAAQLLAELEDARAEPRRRLVGVAAAVERRAAASRRAWHATDARASSRRARPPRRGRCGA